MSATKKATCGAPSAVVAACHACFGTIGARSPAAGYARLIADGIALLSRTDQKAKLLDLCRKRYPVFDRKISTHIPISAREQARHLRRAKAIASLAELYLEATLASLIERGCMTADLDAAYPATGSLPRPAEPRRHAA